MIEVYTVLVTDLEGRLIKSVGLFTEQITAKNWAQEQSLVHRDWIYELVKFEWAF